jgi:uncharacterized protein YqfA (UPF0365 family)
MQPELKYFLAGLACGIGLTVLVSFGFKLFSPWLRALTSGGRVSMMQIFGMRLRGNPPRMMVDAYLSLIHSGMNVGMREVESAYIAHRGKVHTAMDLVNLIRASKRLERGD